MREGPWLYLLTARGEEMPWALEPTPCQIPIYHLLHPLFQLGFMRLKGRKIAGFLELFNRSTHQGSGVHRELKFL